MTINDTPLEEFDALDSHHLLAITAQQAVTPRPLQEGVYAILDAVGALQLVETPGYKQRRKFEWTRAHSDKPEFIHRQVIVHDVPSFVDYLTRNTDISGGTALYDHGAGELELWADVDKQRITAVLDGHNGLRKHTATLQLTPSREWVEWARVDGGMYKQAEFAQFIEDHISTIGHPDGGTLLDVTQTLQATTSTVFKQQAILANGQRQFRWEETVEARAGQSGDLKIPSELLLVLRPFQGATAVQITARFRFAIREGRLSLGVKLAEPEKAIEEAFAVVMEQVQAQMPVLIAYGVG